MSLVLVLALASAHPGYGSDLSTPLATEASTELSVENSTAVWLDETVDFIVGMPADPTFYLGMWSYHFINDSEEYRTDHDLVGVCYNGYFLGTFMNSLDNRSYSAGIQRDVYRNQQGDFGWRFGYRAGLVYGYDELSLFDSKLFPMVQLYSDLSYKKVGLQLSWAGSAILAGLFYRF